jgi:hypothetical protein
LDVAVRLGEATVKTFSEVGRGRFEEDGDSKGISSIASRLDVTVKVCRLALYYRDITWQTLVGEQDRTSYEGERHTHGEGVVGITPCHH